MKNSKNIKEINMTITNETVTAEAKIKKIFDAQLNTSLMLRKGSIEKRIQKLKQLQNELINRREEFYKAFKTDFNKPKLEVEYTEIFTVIDEIKYTTSHLKQWTTPTQVSSSITAIGTSSYIKFEPRGRCLILGPWNYPLNTILCPLVSAIAAGNTVIIKPSEHVPTVNKVLIDLIHSVFDKTEVAVVLGDESIAKELLSLPFNHVYFTGSPIVGKKIMAAASHHLSSITLELGGKSPVIVDESADMANVVSTIWWGKLINAGQSCVAPDYCFVHQSVYDKFLQESVKIIKKRYGDDAEARQKSHDLARIITDQHFSRVNNLIKDAVDQGAQLIIGGDNRAEDRFVDTTLLVNIPTDAKILQEEIFGPVLPVISYNHIEQVIEYINQRDKPLALYVFSTKQTVIDNIIQNTSSGSICVNECMTQYSNSNLPFGGVNNSGIGNAHGFFGFRAFSHERAVLTSKIKLAQSFVVPPYHPVKLKTARLLSSSVNRLTSFYS